MSDLISRQAVIDKINEQQRKLIYCFGFENDMAKIMDVARRIIITAQSEHIERKEGKWISLDDGYVDYVKCDQCGKISDIETNFCQKCGADMRKEEHLMEEYIYGMEGNEEDGSL